MSFRTEYQHGTPNWVDLGSPDTAVAQQFYESLMGWTTVSAGPDADGYRTFQCRGQDVAGLGPLSADDQEPAWTTYISVDDVEAAAAKVTELGGVVLVEPTDALDAGRLAVAADPAGATFVLWQPKAQHGAALVNEPGAWCWNELLTDDVEAASQFYGELFGWVAKADPDGYHELYCDGRAIGGMTAAAEGSPPGWLVYLAVDDCDAAVAAAAGSGGRVLAPPADIPEVGRFAVLADPAEAVFAVVALNEPQ